MRFTDNLSIIQNKKKRMKKILLVQILLLSSLFAQERISLGASHNLGMVKQESLPTEIVQKSSSTKGAMSTKSGYVLYDITSGGNTLFHILLTASAGFDVCFAPQHALYNSVQLFKDDNATVNFYNNTVTHSNSFGGWFYFDSLNGGYNGGCTLADRSKGATRVFRFTLSPTGILSISRQNSAYSTVSTNTTVAVPMDEWIYIQGHQLGNNYTVGWKKEDGTEHTASGSNNPIVSITPEAYNFDISCASDATHIFWQPGKTMFAWFSQTNVSSAEIYQMSQTHNAVSSEFLTALLYAIDDSVPDTLFSKSALTIYKHPDTNLDIIDLSDMPCQWSLPPLLEP